MGHLGAHGCCFVQGAQSIGSLSSGDLEDPDFSKEQDLELKCARAFKAVLHFEQTHCLQVEVRFTSLSLSLFLPTISTPTSSCYGSLCLMKSHCICPSASQATILHSVAMMMSA